MSRIVTRPHKTTTKLHVSEDVHIHDHITHSTRLFTKVNIKEILAFPPHNIFISKSSLTLKSTHDSRIRGRNSSSCLCEINMRISRMQLGTLQKILVLFFPPPPFIRTQILRTCCCVGVRRAAPAFPLLLPKWPNLVSVWMHPRHEKDLSSVLGNSELLVADIKGDFVSKYAKALTFI